MSDPIDAFATAVDMLAALRARRVSAVELLELHLKRIARHNPELNAIVELDFERARREAEAADTRRARGEDAPLRGLPMTLKESINVRGLRTTAGMSVWKDFRAEHDAPVTTRVKGAGAVVMAKTNVPQMLADWQSSNPVYGRTNNPWDLARTPGGSTGGGAAALAAGLTPLEFGSDIGGSIRVPAAFCGVYGHRPNRWHAPRTISSWRWTSRRVPRSVRTSRGGSRSRRHGASAWRTSGSRSCPPSTGCPSMARSPRRWKTSSRGSAGSAARSRPLSPRGSPTIASITRST